MKLPFQPKNSEIITALSFNRWTALEFSEVSNECSRPTIVSEAISLDDRSKIGAAIALIPVMVVPFT